MDRKTPVLEFSCECCGIFKNSIFYRKSLVAAFGYNNQSKIFRERTASKSHGQHATQFSFCSYEGLCPAVKQKPTVGVSNGSLRNFRTATFENNFVVLSLKRKQRKRRTCSDPCGFRFLLFQGQLSSHKTKLFLLKFSHSGAFQFGLCYPFLYT